MTPTAGGGGNFIVSGTRKYNEVLGDNGLDTGVPKIRAELSQGDQIQISALYQVTFTPVTTPFVTTHSPANL